MIIIGADLSLRSPGFSAWNTSENKWTLACFYLPCLQKVFPWLSARETSTFALTKTTDFIVYPRISKDDEDTMRYEHIISHVQYFINHVNMDKQDVRIYLEGYAFAKRFAGSDYKIKELTGIFKYTFRKLNIISVPITTWKKKISGKGNMDKNDSLKKIKDDENLDLIQILGTSDNPSHDISDAMCLALYGKLQIA